MREPYVHKLDETFAIRINQPVREAARNVLANASLLILQGAVEDMQVTGFAIHQGDKRRYVTGPSHWWRNNTDRGAEQNPDNGVDQNPDKAADQTPKKNREKPPRIEFFRPSDDGLLGIPRRVQELFLDAYDASLKVTN